MMSHKLLSKTNSFWVISLLVTLRVSVCSAKTYCGDDYCNSTKQHILCKYQSAQPAAGCIGYANIVTEDDKSAILQKINSRRNKVAAGELSSLPSAANMLKMLWSEELAVSAQRWADQCVQHSASDIKDTCLDSGNTSVGQNIATVYGEAPGLTAAALVDVWYMELLNLNATVIGIYRPSVEVRSTHYDYFTQLVWADSHRVGCGGVRFKVSGSGENRTVYRLVCNFAPGGNRVGEPVYEGGAPCSRCRSSCDDQHAALCQSEFASIEIVPSITPIYAQNANILQFDKHTASMTSQTEMTSSATEENASKAGNDELFPAFDYFSHRHEFVSQEITITTDKPASCKDVLAIDELLELLKKKLSSDPALKDLLSTKKYLDQTDKSLPDAGVAAFVSRLYSKKELVTTTKPVDNEYINSTLLADLVEAVIFRGGERYSATERLALTLPYTDRISPIRIQAELAKVRINNDFTGHYFFPEDEQPQSSTSGAEIDAEYYTVKEMPISDVVLELEDIKRNTEFKDFVDEILESETSTVSTKLLLSDDLASFNVGHNKMNMFLEDSAEENDKIPLVPTKDLSITTDHVKDFSK